MTYRHAEPAPIGQEEPEGPPPETLMKIYYPFPDDIYITMPDGVMVIISLSFYLEAPAAELMHLQEKAKAGQPEIKAALLETAQLAAEQAADIATLRADLPSLLRAKINEKLGSEESPEPISEVLLTQFLSR